MEKARKGSHLTKEERRVIAALHEEGKSPYAIGKLTGRASNTIRNEPKMIVVVPLFSSFLIVVLARPVNFPIA